MSVIKKIWGIKHRLLSNNMVEVDLLTLDANTACSIHKHSNKHNRFILLRGSVTIKSDLGDYELKINETFNVEPGVIHQFVIHEPSTMIEIAYVESGQIDANDIDRYVQGGKFVNGEFFSLDQLRIEGILDL